jgi:SAM-dependent methyltransferase
VIPSVSGWATSCGRAVKVATLGRKTADCQDEGMVQFSRGVNRWLGGLGRLRDLVRQHLVAEQLAATLADWQATPCHILDVGCGQGTQAMFLARAGHTVTGIDSSDELLNIFAATLAEAPADVRSRVRLIRGSGEDATTLAPGPFDLVCCHGVLMYLADFRPMLSALSNVAAKRAVFSLLVRNGLSTAMRPGLLGDWSGAVRAFDRHEYINRLGLSARAHTPAELDQVLREWGWARAEWYGIRVFTDHLDEDAPSADKLDLVLAAERAAAIRDPYRQVAALLHLIYVRWCGGERVVE